jgi:hypothetical protein
MSLYAPVLDHFHGSSNVSRETVQAAKQRLLSAIEDVRRFEMHDVRLLPARDGSVRAEFRIESDAAGRAVAGSYRLELRPAGPVQWKIHGEEASLTLSRRGR